MDAACWFCRTDRPQNEIKEIASVSGNTVTFTSPLHKAYRTSHHAELTTYTGGNQHVVDAGDREADGRRRRRRRRPLRERGVLVGEEHRGDRPGTARASRSTTPSASSCATRTSTTRRGPSPAAPGYAISLSGGSSEVLIENNISVKANKVMVARSSGTCSVVGYNYMDDGYIATTEAWLEIGLNASHMVGSHHVLFEGNQSFNMDSDNTHGDVDVPHVLPQLCHHRARQVQERLHGQHHRRHDDVEQRPEARGRRHGLLVLDELRRQRARSAGRHDDRERLRRRPVSTDWGERDLAARVERHVAVHRRPEGRADRGARRQLGQAPRNSRRGSPARRRRCRAPSTCPSKPAFFGVEPVAVGRPRRRAPSARCRRRPGTTRGRPTRSRERAQHLAL